jgi:hypothetical protein
MGHNGEIKVGEKSEGVVAVARKKKVRPVCSWSQMMQCINHTRDVRLAAMLNKTSEQLQGLQVRMRTRAGFILVAIGFSLAGMAFGRIGSEACARDRGGDGDQGKQGEGD